MHGAYARQVNFRISVDSRLAGIRAAGAPTGVGGIGGGSVAREEVVATELLAFLASC